MGQYIGGILSLGKYFLNQTEGRSIVPTCTGINNDSDLFDTPKIFIPVTQVSSESTGNCGRDKRIIPERLSSYPMVAGPNG